MNLIQSIIATAAIYGALLGWQYVRPSEPIGGRVYFFLEKGENGLLTWQPFYDGTIEITYRLRGDTIESGNIDRKEFNKLIRRIYPGDYREKANNLRTIPPPVPETVNLNSDGSNPYEQ